MRRAVFSSSSAHSEWACPFLITPVCLLLGAPLYLDSTAPERLRSTGQTLLAMVGIGWGGAVSNATAGWLLDHVGPNAPYLLGGAGAVILGCLVPRILPPPEREPGSEKPTDRSQSYVALDI